MMGVRGLHSHILKSPKSRERLDLKQAAELIRKQTRKPAELLCDFYPVVKWLLASFESAQVQMGTLSPYSIMYGGILPESHQRIVDFVDALKSIDITPVFFVAGPPGSSRQSFDSLLPKLRQSYEKRLEQCSTIHQVCTNTQNLTRLKWILREDVAAQAEHTLQSCSVRLIHCAGATSASMLKYLRLHAEVCGVLSSDTVFALAAQATLVLPELFDVDSVLGIDSDSICTSCSSLVCEVVSPASLAGSLGLQEQQLADLAILCSDMFSGDHSSGRLPYEELGIDAYGIDAIAKWLQRQEPNCLLLGSPALQKFCHDHPGSTKVFSDAYMMYHGDGSGKCTSVHLNFNSSNNVSASTLDSSDTEDHCALVHSAVPPSIMSQKLTAITNGIYWRYLLPEAITLNQPSFSAISLPLRRKIYLLLGLKQVTEFGRTTSKSFDEVHVSLPASDIDPSSLGVLCSLETDKRLLVLFNLVACSEAKLLSGLGGVMQRCVAECSKLDSAPSGKVVLVCASFLFLLMADHQHSPSPGVRICEFDALLVSCLACAAGLPPCRVAVLPPPRAISIAMLFTHIVQQVSLLATLLNLSSKLPPPSDVFYPLPYIAYHMASYAGDSVEHPQPVQLSGAYGIFNTVFEFKSVLQLRAELFNCWKCPDVPRLLNLFDSAVKSLQHFKRLLTVWQNRPKSTSLSNRMGDERDGETSGIDVGGFVWSQKGKSGADLDTSGKENGTEEWCGRECSRLDSSRLESVSSDTALHCSSELPASEDYVASEENLYFAAQTLPHDTSPPPDYITDATTLAAGDASVAQSKTGMDEGDLEEEALSEIANGLEVPPEILIAQRKQKVRAGHALPILKHRSEILELIASHQVICIEGETGCGKSTKVPQFILDKALPGECRVLVTQPRRVAAVRLAERVANEMKERPGLTVGYCVGGDHRISSKTVLTYCTMGYMLQRLIHNPDMVCAYTHIILDEIHERSTDADFAMVVLRKLAASLPDIKIILMSATMQGDLLVHYFREVIPFERVAQPFFVGARRYPVETFFLDELQSLVTHEREFWHPNQAKSAEGLRLLVAHRPVQRLQSALMARPDITDYTQDVCTETIISQANLGESMLVFLPGISEITSYYERLIDELRGRNLIEHFSIFILHSHVCLEDMKEAFKPPRPDKVHVLLATNIAESSITLPKLRMVINFAIYRRTEYIPRRRITCLAKRWCSHASCSQRAGRVGRVFEGVAVHLITRAFYDIVLSEYDPPEMQTVPIAKLLLQAKQIGSKLNISLPSELLSLAIEPPSLQQMEAALTTLAALGAIVSQPGIEASENADITLLGHLSLSLPVDIELSRLILFGVIFFCPVDAVVMAASMSSLAQDVFSLPTRLVITSDRDFQSSLLHSLKNRFAFDQGVYSDSIAVCVMFRAWMKERISKPDCSRIVLARQFASRHALRWYRLLHMECLVSEIAARLLPHISASASFHNDLKTLSSLSGSRGKSAPLLPLGCCANRDVLRALLCAAFSHQMLVGGAGNNIPNRRGRTKAMEDLHYADTRGLDIRHTLVMRGLKEPSPVQLTILSKAILPETVCRGMVSQDRGFIEIAPMGSFGTHPKTAIMRAAMADRDEQIKASVFSTDNFLLDKSVVVSPLPMEVFLLWQFGERRPHWRVEGLSAEFTRPQHLLAVDWQRLGGKGTKVWPTSWRYPTGLLCELANTRPSFYLGVASTMQETANGCHVVASNIMILPPLRSGPMALLFTLAFLPLDTELCFCVDPVQGIITGLRVNSHDIHFFGSSRDHLTPLTAEDIVSVNALRSALSDIFCSIDSHGCIPVDTSAKVPHLLGSLIRLGYGRPPVKRMVGETIWEDAVGSREESSGGVADRDRGEPTLASYQYYPPLVSSRLRTNTSGSRQSLSPTVSSADTSDGGSVSASGLSPYALPFFPSESECFSSGSVLPSSAPSSLPTSPQASTVLSSASEAPRQMSSKSSLCSTPVCDVRQQGSSFPYSAKHIPKHSEHQHAYASAPSNDSSSQHPSPSACEMSSLAGWNRERFNFPGAFAASTYYQDSSLLSPLPRCASYPQQLAQCSMMELAQFSFLLGLKQTSSILPIVSSAVEHAAATVGHEESGPESSRMLPHLRLPGAYMKKCGGGQLVTELEGSDISELEQTVEMKKDGDEEEEDDEEEKREEAEGSSVKAAVYSSVTERAPTVIRSMSCSKVLQEDPRDSSNCHTVKPALLVSSVECIPKPQTRVASPLLLSYQQGASPDGSTHGVSAQASYPPSGGGPHAPGLFMRPTAARPLSPTSASETAGCQMPPFLPHVSSFPLPYFAPIPTSVPMRPTCPHGLRANRAVAFHYGGSSLPPNTQHSSRLHLAPWPLPPRLQVPAATIPRQPTNQMRTFRARCGSPIPGYAFPPGPWQPEKGVWSDTSGQDQRGKKKKGKGQRNKVPPQEPNTRPHQLPSRQQVCSISSLMAGEELGTSVLPADYSIPPHQQRHVMDSSLALLALPPDQSGWSQRSVSHAQWNRKSVLSKTGQFTSGTSGGDSINGEDEARSSHDGGQRREDAEEIGENNELKFTEEDKESVMVRRGEREDVTIVPNEGRKNRSVDNSSDICLEAPSGLCTSQPAGGGSLRRNNLGSSLSLQSCVHALTPSTRATFTSELDLSHRHRQSPTQDHQVYSVVMKAEREWSSVPDLTKSANPAPKTGQIKLGEFPLLGTTTASTLQLASCRYSSSQSISVHERSESPHLVTKRNLNQIRSSSLPRQWPREQVQSTTSSLCPQNSFAHSDMELCTVGHGDFVSTHTLLTQSSISVHDSWKERGLFNSPLCSGDEYVKTEVRESDRVTQGSAVGKGHVKLATSVHRMQPSLTSSSAELPSKEEGEGYDVWSENESGADLGSSESTTFASEPHSGAAESAVPRQLSPTDLKSTSGYRYPQAGTDEHMLLYFKKKLHFYRCIPKRILHLATYYIDVFSPQSFSVEDVTRFLQKHPDVFKVSNNDTVRLWEAAEYKPEGQGSTLNAQAVLVTEDGTESGAEEGLSRGSLDSSHYSKPSKATTELASKTPSSHSAALDLLSVKGSQRLEEDIGRFILEQGGVVFQSDLKHSKKLSVLSQVCQLTLDRNFFHSRPKMFEVCDHCWDEHSNDFQIVLVDNYAKQLYNHPSGGGGGEGGGGRGEEKGGGEKSVREAGEERKEACEKNTEKERLGSYRKKTKSNRKKRRGHFSRDENSERPTEREERERSHRGERGWRSAPSGGRGHHEEGGSRRPYSGGQFTSRRGGRDRW